MNQPSLFDEMNRLELLSKIGDPLEKFNTLIDWKSFESTLNRAFKRNAKGPGGRPPFPYVLMFKIIVLQRLYNLSDDQTEFQINDRLTFMRFLGLGINDKVPDSKTIWHFKEQLKEMKLIRTLFNKFERQLETRGLITHTGSIVDATFVEAPRQRNRREENKEIKEGKTPEEWEQPENINKLRQKDLDARWTKKNNVTFYGYKDHAKVDADSKLITDYMVTDASVHDSQAFVELLDETKDRVVYADSAYSGKPIEEKIPKNIETRIHEKGSRNHPLTEEQKANNREKSKIRVRIEHVFGFMTGSMKGITLRCIGKKRAEFNIGLTNLVYNMARYTILQRKKRCMA